MKFCFLLAGGKGSRFGDQSLPKQFHLLSGKPVIIHTLDKLISINTFDKIIVACNIEFIDYLKNIINKNFLNLNISVINGGNTRTESVLNCIKYVQDNFNITNNDIFLAHDAVRPFVSSDNLIEVLTKCYTDKAVSTVTYLTESVIKISDKNIKSIEDRENQMLDYSPQAFNLNYFIDCTKKISYDKLINFSDLSQCILENNGNLTYVVCDKSNIKITTKFDLFLASQMIKYGGIF